MKPDGIILEILTSIKKYTDILMEYPMTTDLVKRANILRNIELEKRYIAGLIIGSGGDLIIADTNIKFLENVVRQLDKLIDKTVHIDIGTMRIINRSLEEILELIKELLNMEELIK